MTTREKSRCATCRKQITQPLTEVRYQNCDSCLGESTAQIRGRIRDAHDRRRREALK